MSRRRASYREYRPLDRDAYARAVYGNPSARRHAPYLHVVEPLDKPTGWRLWLGSALSLVVTVVLCLLVIAAWTVGRRLLAAGVL